VLESIVRNEDEGRKKEGTKDEKRGRWKKNERWKKGKDVRQSNIRRKWVQRGDEERRKNNTLIALKK
jgi:hypothetical protein